MTDTYFTLSYNMLEVLDVQQLMTYIFYIELYK
jgi:hypothetical protein